MKNNNRMLRCIAWLIGIAIVAFLQVNDIWSWADVCFIGGAFSVLIWLFRIRLAVLLTLFVSFFILSGHYVPLVSLHSEIELGLMNGVQASIGRGINILLNAGIYFFSACVCLFVLLALLAMLKDLTFRRYR